MKREYKILIVLLLFLFPLIYIVLQNTKRDTKGLIKIVKGKAKVVDNYQVIKIIAKGGQYSPNLIFVKKNIPLKIYISRNEKHSCTNKIIFPDLNIKKDLKQNGVSLVEFTPQKTGEFLFTCQYKMVKGIIVVK